MLEYASSFNNEELFLKHFDYWTITLRDSQVTLGSCIIILNRECPNFTEIKAEEMAEFPKVCAWFEEKCKNLWGADKFNYLALMMKDHYVHFHAIPRYSKSIDKYGTTWTDEDWPTATTLKGVEASQETLQEIRADFLK